MRKYYIKSKVSNIKIDLKVTNLQAAKRVLYADYANSGKRKIYVEEYKLIRRKFYTVNTDY